MWPDRLGQRHHGPMWRADAIYTTSRFLSHSSARRAGATPSLAFKERHTAEIFHLEQPIRSVEGLSPPLQMMAAMMGSPGGGVRGLGMFSKRVSARERLGNRGGEFYFWALSVFRAYRDRLPDRYADAAHGGNSRRRPMLMLPARRTQWLSLAAMAMAAAAAITVILIVSPGRSAPVPGAAASVGKAALGQDAPSEPRANRASPPTVSDKVSGQRALILYILTEA